MNLQVRKNRLSAFRASSVFPSFFAWLAQVANLPLRIVHYCLHFCPFFGVLIDNFIQLVRTNKGALLLNPRQPLLRRWSKEAEFCSKQPSFWTLSSLSSCEKEEEWSSCEKEEEWQWRNCCSWSWVGCKASRPLCATKLQPFGDHYASGSCLDCSTCMQVAADCSCCFGNCPTTK